MKTKIMLSLLMLLLAIASLGQQSNLEKAWTAFEKNDLMQAKLHFTEATRDQGCEAEAYFMLSMIANIFQSDDETLENFMRFSEFEPDINPYFTSFFYSEAIGFSGEKQKGKMINFLNDLLDSGKLNQTVSCYIYEILGAHYLNINDLKKSREYYSRIGSITDWQITGTFENQSGSGFDKDFGPIENAQASSKFINKYQAEVSWFDMIETHPGKWNYLTYHFDADNSVIYAQTFCKSPTDQDVVFRIGTSGSLKTWVNDKLLFAEPRERNNGLDTYTFTAQLNEGSNRILLQIGSSEITASNFLVRITDTDGHNIPNLEISGSYQLYQPDNGSFQSESKAYFAETFFLNKINEEPDKLLYRLLLANTYLNNDKNYFARKTIREAQKIAPECSYLLSQLIQSYLRDENRTLLSQTLEKLKETDPDNPIAINLFYNEAVGNEDFEEASELIEKMKKLVGENENTLQKEIQMAASREQYEIFYDLIEKGYVKYPENEYFVSLKTSLELKVKKNTKQADKILKSFLKKKYNAEIIASYASIQFTNGEIDEGLKTLKKLVEYEPNAVGYYNKIGSVYFALRDYTNALMYFDKCIQFAPYLESYYYYKGQCYAEMGQKLLAIQAYQDAIKYYPASYNIRNELRTLESKKPVFDLFEETDLESVFKNSPDASAYPGSSSLILLDEVQRVVYAEGGTQEKTIFMVKVFNSEGIDDWKEYYIPTSAAQNFSIEKAEVLKKDGSKVAAETDYDYVAFTALEEGDAISIVYKIDTYKSGKFMKHFTDFFHFDVYVPALTKKYSLLISPEIEFKYVIPHKPFEPTVKDVGDFKMYVWEEQNLDKVDYEDYMPELVDVEPVLHISTIPDWDFISGWYADITSNKIKSDFLLQEKVAELFEGKGNLGDLEKAKIIYEYITGEIRYSSLPFRQSGYIPKRASEIIAARIGDCKDVSTLFVAMCKEVGIEANYVLVNTRENGKNESPLPSIIFDHCIAKAKIDGEDYFVELTSEQLPFASLGTNSLHAFALIAENDPELKSEPFYLDPPTRVKNNILRQTTVEFADGKMNFSCNSDKSGVLASQMRDTYKNLNAEEQKSALLSSLARDHTSVVLNDFIFYSDLNTPEANFKYKYDYSIKNHFTKINDLEIFNIPLTDNYSNTGFVSAETRKYPMEIWSSLLRCDEYNEDIHLKIPEGKSMAEIPEDVVLINDFGTYSLTFILEDDALHINRKLEFYPEVISPDEYPSFREFIISIVENDNKKLAFQ